MQIYIREGRIIAESLVTQNPAGNFYPAGQSALFKPVSKLGQTETQAGNQPNQFQGETGSATAILPSVFLIMAEFGTGQAMKFLHKLQKLGSAQRIGDTVWLLRTDLDTEELRDQLAATMGRQDRLFILDSFNHKTAWFNIGADMDERIKSLWKSP